MKSFLDKKVNVLLVIGLVVFFSGMSAFVTSYYYKQQLLNELQKKEVDKQNDTDAKDAVPESPIPLPNLQSFHGVLPCGDCSGISTELLLQKDPTDPTEGVYTMKQTYQGRSATPISTLGKWDVVRGTPKDPQAVVIKLKKGKELFEYWLVVNNDTLELLSPQEDLLTPPGNFRLQRDK